MNFSNMFVSLLASGFSVIVAAATWLVAQTSSDPGDLGTWAPLLNLGAVGIMVILFVTGRIHSEKEFAEVRKERDDAVADGRVLRDTLIKELMPALTRVNEATARATEALLKRDG